MATRARFGRMIDRVTVHEDNDPRDDGYCSQSEITHVRIASEGYLRDDGGWRWEWTLDGANADGSRYSEVVWLFDSFDAAVKAIRPFLVEYAPHLLSEKEQS